MIKRAKKQLIELNTSQIITLGFAGVIFVGALLLWLPWATVEGETTTFLDALFLSTSSVCVTGLATVVTATHWTLFGKAVILLLIQLGGLGIVTVTTLLMMVLGKRIGLRARRVIQESYNLDSLGGMVMIIRKVVFFTLASEAVGAILFSIFFVPEMGWIDGIGNGIFTSISSFCNAGLDILGDASFIPYVGHWGINITAMALIIAGGLGFTVWFDLIAGLRTMIRKKHSIWYFWHGLMVHSKVAISMTVFLIVGGTLLFFVFEYNNPDTIGTLPMGNKILASAFQSVTTRTAGFQTVDQSFFTDSSTILTIFLMLIGGSPMGTAGGLKTTTIAILIMTVIAYLRGNSDTEIFNRKVQDNNIRTAIVVSSMAVLAFAAGTIGVSVSMDTGFGDAVFEVASALGTVGLSRGITPELPFVAKTVIIMCMYLGRIGPITLAAAITMHSNKQNNNVHLAEERILIG